MFYKQLQLFDIVNLAASHCCTRNVDSHNYKDFSFQLIRNMVQRGTEEWTVEEWS